MLAGCGGGGASWEESVPTARLSSERKLVAEALATRPGSNVLLITIDTLRGDHLACYGHPGIQTPNIDELASRGVVFTDAVCSAPITLPSHCSIMTGLYPTAHGVRDNGRFELDESFETLAEVFHENGYRTGAFVGAFPVSSKFGLTQGFEIYSDQISKFHVAQVGLMKERVANEVTAPALEWIDDLDGGPFFIWMHYFDPHWPYEPPEPFASRYGPDEQYEGEIAFVDHEIGRVLAAIERKGVAENTLVVVSADHGEGLGEHHEYSHSILLYDSTMHVPLVMAPAAPGSTAGGPLIVTSQVRSIDIMPTILELAGLDAPLSINGIALRDDSGAPVPPEAALCYMETYATWYGFTWSPLRCVRSSEWKLVEAPRFEMYNLANDPRELENLLPAERASSEPWRVALADVGAEAVTPVETDMDSETIERLRALGYLGMGRDIEQPRPKSGNNPDLPNPIDVIDVYFGVLGPAMDRFNRGEFGPAIELAKLALARDPNNLQGLTVLASSQTRIGHYEEAAQTYKRILQLDPKRVAAHFSLATIAHRVGDLEQAEEAYRVVLSMDPSFGEALHDLAVVLMDKGKLEEAEQLLLRSVDEDTTFSYGYRVLGNLYLREERRAEALDAFLSALAIDPQMQDVESQVLGLVTADDELGRRALERLESEWDSGKRAEGVMLPLVEVAYLRGRQAFALGLLEEAIGEGRESAAILRVRAWIHKKQGRDDLALADLRAGVELEPDNPNARANLAAYYRSNGRAEEAKREYEACLKLDPRSERALVGLGIILAEWRQLGQAMQLWEQAVIINPQSAAKENLARARQMLGEGGTEG